MLRESSIAIAKAFPIAAFAFVTGVLSAQNTPASGALVCPIVYASPNDGDKALAKQDYDKALIFFQAAVAKDPSSQEGRLGLVRALIGKDRVDEARQEATRSLSNAPQSAIAEIAVSEAAFRAADFEVVRLHSQAALKDNGCDGRAYALIARIFALHARFASAAKFLDTAHTFRPGDELIRRDWIGSLRPKDREEEIEKYLAGENSLSEADRQGLVDEDDHLKAHRSGECRVVSKSDSVNIPFTPVLGRGQRPVAFGLPVAFNGKKHTMQIDTGAPGIVLTLDAAKRLKLIPEYHLHSSGIGDHGEVKSYLTHVERIQIGDVELSNCMVEVLEQNPGMAADTDGLIGLDVFSRWLVTLDYPHRSLLLDPLPPLPDEKARTNPGSSGSEHLQDEGVAESPVDGFDPPAMRGWMHVIRVGHQILLPSSLNDGPVRFLIVDTGADSTCLSTPFAQQAGKITEDISVRFSGISGKVNKTYRLDNAVLRFGRLALPKDSFYAFDLTKTSHDTGAEVSGLIGFPTLSRLTLSIDYRDNLMDMRYDPKHDPVLVRGN